MRRCRFTATAPSTAPARMKRAAHQSLGADTGERVVGRQPAEGGDRRSGWRSGRIFLLDDPTRGVDVGAQARDLFADRRMSADGGVVLFARRTASELVGLCDRILAIYQGRLVSEVALQRTYRRPHAAASSTPAGARFRKGCIMAGASRTSRRRRQPDAGRDRVIALVAAMIIIGVAAALHEPHQPGYALLGNTTFLALRNAGHGLPAGDPRRSTCRSTG